MSRVTRVAFPDELLVPDFGWLSGFTKSGRGFRPSPRAEYTAIIPLRPFKLPSGHPLAGEPVDTSIQFQGLRLPAERVRDLAGASFEFSEDDAESIAVGELQIAFSYVPVFLHRLTLGSIEDGRVNATFEMRIGFEEEDGGDDSGFLSREAVVRASLELNTEPALLPAFSLLGGAFRPATTSFLFLEVPPIQLADWLERWVSSHGEAREVRQRKLTGALSDALQHLAPLTAVAIRRRLIAPTRSSWSAYTDNSILGTDPLPFDYLCSEFSCRAVRMVCQAEATMFELYGAQGQYEGSFGFTQHLVRFVYVTNEGSWTFDTAGEPQPFEQPERYAERRIRDRFTPEMLSSYSRSARNPRVRGELLHAER